MLKRMAKKGSERPWIGILGAGQLAQMMAQAAKHLGVRTRVAAATQYDPAVSTADDYALISLEDQSQVSHFCSSVDLLLFESELANFNHLLPIANEGQIQTFPKLTAMQACADKFQQKQNFAKLGIASPDFIYDQTHHPLQVDDLRSRFPNGCVLKWSRHGYDGRGNFFWNDAEPEQQAAMESFCQQGRERGAIIYAEELVSFVAELALVSVYKRDGEACFYPLVLTKQRRGVCETVQGPAAAFLEGASTHLQGQAEQIARRLAEELQLHGTFAIEFFLDEQGQLLANEVAPRVHNSGHATMNACWGSQFENHLRAALDLPLSNCNNHSFFGMLNLLGPDDYEGPAEPPSIKSADAWLYWYDKTICKPGRKMGHINLVAPSPESLQQQLGEIQEEILQWAQSLTKPESLSS